MRVLVACDDSSSFTSAVFLLRLSSIAFSVVARSGNYSMKIPAMFPAENVGATADG